MNMTATIVLVHFSGITNTPSNNISQPSNFSESVTNDNNHHSNAFVFLQFLYLVTVLLVTVTGNTLVLYLIVKHLKCTSFTNTFISSLSISDLLGSLSCLPLTLVTIIGRNWIIGNNVACAISSSLNNLFAIASTYMLMCIVLDRYLVIAKVPRSEMTTKLANGAIVFAWVLATVLSAPWYYIRLDGAVNRTWYKPHYVHCTYAFHLSYSNEGTAYSCVLLVLGYVLPAGAMTISCTRIWNVIHRTETGVQPASLDPTRLRLAGELRTAKTVLILVLVFLSTKMPYIVVGTFYSALRREISPSVDTVLFYAFWTTGAAIPFVYANRNEYFSEFLHIRRPPRTHSFSNISPQSPPSLPRARHRVLYIHKRAPPFVKPPSKVRPLPWQKSNDLFNVTSSSPIDARETCDAPQSDNPSPQRSQVNVVTGGELVEEHLSVCAANQTSENYDGSRKGSDWSTATTSTTLV